MTESRPKRGIPHWVGTAAFALALVIAALVFSLYQLDVLSLPFTLWGMSTFVVAIFVEAIREFYFAIIQREEIS